jgi:hypothetical protein
MVDERRHAAPAERNREPILNVLRIVLPERGLLLEVASGTGQHVAHFAAALPALTFQPSEFDPNLHASIAAWTHGLANVRPPIGLDVTAEPWPVPALVAVFNANMIHIAPWDACLGLMRGAAGALDPGGVLVMYGPYRIGGRHTADSNAAFDQRLRGEDARWGVRDFEAVCDAAAERGLQFERRFEMPANNQTLVFRKPAR